MDVTTKPIIFDGDNGGEIHHIPYLIKPERLVHLQLPLRINKIKQNSLFSDQSSKQDNIKALQKNKINSKN